MKSILFVGMYPDVVSPYRNVFFQNLIFALADKGIDCTVISPIPITKYLGNTRKVPYHTFDKTEKGNTVDVYYPRSLSLSNKRIGKIHTGVLTERLYQKAALKTAKSIRKSFDAVYGHFLLSGGLSAIQIGEYYNIPSFFAYGECDYYSEVIRQYGPVKKEEVEGLNGIISVSTNNLNTLKKVGIFNDVPILVAPNSVDMELFYKRDKAECRKQLGLPENKFIVGFVGGFVHRKGAQRLLEAINRVDGVYGAFAGVGEEKPEGEKVLFCKPLKHNEVPIFLNAIDVFCLPTLNEGSCNAIVEAASCGLPIISSDLPFNDDLLNDNNSLRINPLSVDEIEEAIRSLYGNTNKLEQMKKAIFEDSREFSIDRRAEKILGFMRHVGQQ